MKHINEIVAAFEDEKFKNFVAWPLRWVPELKHESLVATALSAFLSEKNIACRREFRVEKSRTSRRYDLTIEGTPMELKYHLDFDIDLILKTISSPLAHRRLERAAASSWNAGQSFLNELHRAKNSYFLWSICARGNYIPDKACMRRQASAWLDRLYGQDIMDSNDYVATKVSEVSCVVKVLFPDTHVQRLALVEGGESTLHSLLFYRSTKL